MLDSDAMSRISRDDVARTAALAQLSLTEEEVESMTRDLGQILDHAAQLQALDTEGIEPTAHALPLPTPVRPDRAQPGIDPERAMDDVQDIEWKPKAKRKVLRDNALNL